MILFLAKLAVRLFVFGVALTFATKRSRDVRVEPREMLFPVAVVFTVLNTVLYSILASALNLGTLWMFFFVVPFIANAIVLLITDRLLRPFKIESTNGLARTAVIVTVAHLLLRLAHV